MNLIIEKNYYQQYHDYITYKRNFLWGIFFILAVSLKYFVEIFFISLMLRQIPIIYDI
jgi:hypothetical protein